MRIGALRHQVTIQERSTTQDEWGTPEDTWTDVVTVWASIQGLRGDESARAQQIGSQATSKIVIRYYAGITTSNRIKFGDRYFDIEHIDNVLEKNETLVMMCKEAT